MSLCCRRFFIADDGTLFRVAKAGFDRILSDPASHPLPVFAGQRVRMAEQRAGVLRSGRWRHHPSGQVRKIVPIRKRTIDGPLVSGTRPSVYLSRSTFPAGHAV
jgi:hypothetical protein